MQDKGLPLLSALACLLLAELTVTKADILLAYSIQRHGARNALPKSALLQESSSVKGPTLLPVGQRMCFTAGQAFRNRYIDKASCGSTCISNSNQDSNYGTVGQTPNTGNGFNNYNTLVRSSDTDRTLVSALSFYSGIFPAVNTASANTSSLGLPTGQQVVPVYTVPDADDWLIRGYTKCNAYQSRLVQWYQSPEFKAKEQASQALRDRVKQLAPGMDTSLTNWWNVFDAFNVWRTYQVGEPRDIDNSTYTDLSVLAGWLETSKMKSGLTGNLLGGALVADMLKYMSAAGQAMKSGSPSYYKLLSISSHYNVQLGVLSALKLDTYAPAVAALNWLDTTIPQPASVLVFELHGSAATGELAAVRLVAQPGAAAQYINVPLPCAQAGDAAEQVAGAGACTWDAFRSMASPAGLATAADWCSACGNTDGNPCALVAAQALLSQSSQTSCNSTDTKRWQLAVGLGVVLTFLATLGLSLIAMWCMHRRLKRRQQSDVEILGIQHKHRPTSI